MPECERIGIAAWGIPVVKRQRERMLLKAVLELAITHCLHGNIHADGAPRARDLAGESKLTGSIYREERQP